MRVLLSALSFLVLLLPALASAADTPAVPAPSWAEVRKARVLQLLPGAMARANVDAWVVVCRENANDPLAVHVGGENAGAQAAFLFLREGEKLRSLALSPEGEAKALRDVALHDEVVSLPRGTDLYAQVAERLARVKPRRIALNLRIGEIEAMWRVRAGAQGPRRAADGASKAARRAGTRDATTPWGTPLPWPPSLEERGRELAIPAEVPSMPECDVPGTSECGESQSQGRHGGPGGPEGA